MTIRFTEDHEYVRVDGDTGTIGISDYAQGQLGDASTSTRTTPVVVSGLSGVTQLTAGDIHTCARRSDGTGWRCPGCGSIRGGKWRWMRSPCCRWGWTWRC